MADANPTTANVVENTTVKTVQKTAENKGPTYTREALAASKKYRAQCDTIMCALDPTLKYTETEAKEKIEAFLKTEIKEKINGKG